MRLRVVALVLSIKGGTDLCSQALVWLLHSTLNSEIQHLGCVIVNVLCAEAWLMFGCRLPEEFRRHADMEEDQVVHKLEHSPSC